MDSKFRNVFVTPRFKWSALRTVIFCIASQCFNLTLAQSPLFPKPVDLKVLVLAGSETEPGYAAIKALLDEVGIPHKDVVLGGGGVLPPLNDATHGLYQGIVLTNGSLSVCDSAGVCKSALPDSGWTALDAYAAAYGVRTLVYYGYPNARYGMAPVLTTNSGQVKSLTTGVVPSTITLTPAGAPLFPYLRTAAVKIANAYSYPANALAATGESTQPILTIDGYTVGVLHKKPDGREYLALSFDNNPNLLHTLALGYGLLNWVTKGVFLGARQIYLTPQVDDLFIPNDLYDANTAGCKPPGFLVDPTADLSSKCPVNRITGDDLNALASWQDAQVASQNPGFKVTLAFNGAGALDDSGNILTTDSLVTAATQNAAKFYWVNHTFDHQNLDCYNAVLNSGVCTPATQQESDDEIWNNFDVATALGLPADMQSMVTPEISGLKSPNFIQAAIAGDIAYLIIDNSTIPPNSLPMNTGVRNTLNPAILMIPRRPTSIFYNVTTSLVGAPGSLPSEYNYFYGPAGLFHIGGASGPPFFTADQTYAQIIDRESESMLLNMLRGDAMPLMFHQSNLWRYNGTQSLFTDVIGQALAKFKDLSTLPVSSLAESAIGQLFLDRMQYNASGVTATWYPPAAGASATITMTAVQAAKVPVTGFCVSNCTNYGGQNVQRVNVKPGTPVTIAQ